MRKNTRLWLITVRTTFWILVTFDAVGVIADFFGFAEGVSEHSDTIMSVLSYCAVRWKWTVALTSSLLIIILLYRRRWKRETEKKDTKRYSWFDADKRSTEYTGGLEYIYELKKFIQQRDEYFSWWAVTGIAGIGKTRLVLETLRQEELRNVDAQWLKSFKDYREENLQKRVDSILESPNFRNIIIAEDAQIYMDNIGALIEYISGKDASEIGDHRIRLLLLIRMGENEDLRDRYKQLASKTSHTTLSKTRFGLFDEELRIDKYSENYIAEIAKSYIVNTKIKLHEKALSEEQLTIFQAKVVDALKAMDVMRPLFAMFIADALIAGKDPMSWDKERVLEYAVVERGEQLLEYETRDIKEEYYHRLFDKVKSITCLSIIRDGNTLLELEGIKEDLEDELKFSKISMKDFLKELQYLGSDGIIRVHMPDILSEYYVLRTIVIKPDVETVNWIIERLTESLEGADVFRKKVRQNFNYLYSSIETELKSFYIKFFEICSKEKALFIFNQLVNEDDIHDSNKIVFHEAISNLIRNGVNKEIISKELSSFIIRKNPEDIAVKENCIDELRRIYDSEKENGNVAFDFSQCLVSMTAYPKITIKNGYLNELEHLADNDKEDGRIIDAFCNALVNVTALPYETQLKKECLIKLEKIAGKYESYNNLMWYGKGIVNMISKTSDIQENNNYLITLQSLAKKDSGDSVLIAMYCKGLYNMINKCMDVHEKMSYLSKIEKTVVDNGEDAHLIWVYSKSIVEVIGDNPQLIEKLRKSLKKLAQRAGNDGNDYTFWMYGEVLFIVILCSRDIHEKRECLKKLELLSKENEDDSKIRLSYSNGLFNMSYSTDDLMEQRDILEKLKTIADNSEEEELKLNYCKCLFNMCSFDENNINDYIDRLKKMLSNKEFAQYVANKAPIIIVNMRQYI